VPIKKKDASALIESFEPYLEFQSTLDYLKNPPPGALNPAIDILAGINDIKLNLEKGVYTNELDFQLAIGGLLQRGYDGHLSWSGDIKNGLGLATRSVELVSLSSDGQQLPKVYVLSGWPHHSLSRGSRC
jgi:hypothetical protein